ncbi:hypothetical protein D7X96_18720 [Corallococcus interemptor]|uniref:ATPase AAA-type core domain-containing protein n=1 Tax=Corallococcus interemptor TaxID=2316720 RepID=A0A3A8QGB3_9BACT|nr:ATP-binding protein [Corallococcus interemptor]RKH67726.1 hypothetical protein D7X96_18720 [Corallococcus interemptor]
MIEKVQFRNFKAYRSLDLELEPFTVLVGPNASGKTTLLEGLRMLSTNGAPALAKNSPRVPVIASNLRSFGSDQPIELIFHGQWGRAPGRIHLRGNALNERGVVHPVSGEWAGKTFSFSKPVVLSAASRRQEELRFYEKLKMELRATAVLRFETAKLAESSYSESAIPEVSSDGSGLASALAYLKLSQEELFLEIELSLKKIVPSVRRIRIERAAVEHSTQRTIALDEHKTQISEERLLWGNRVVLDMQGAKGVPADSAGEGTLMVLGLLTVLLGAKKPRLVLLDDIELSLHPVAQGKLIEVLRAIQKNDPELQIVATSHSPFILNYLKPEEIRMTFLAENGFARCEKLTAHPEFEKWKGLMSPGEFWSTVGESWIAKVPASAPHE